MSGAWFWSVPVLSLCKQLEMDDPEDTVPKEAALPRQPSSARAGTNPATSPDSPERHGGNGNGGSHPVSEVHSDSPLLRTSTSINVERPLSGSHGPTLFDSTVASMYPEKKYGVSQPSPQYTHANRGDDPSRSPTRPQLPGYEPRYQNPQPRAQAQPVNNPSSSRQDIYSSLPSHPLALAQLAHAPTHTPPLSQGSSGGDVVRVWGPKEEQNCANRENEMSGDVNSPVSPNGHIPRAETIIICISQCIFSHLIIIRT